MSNLAAVSIILLTFLLIVPIAVTLGNTICVLSSLFYGTYRSKKEFIEELIWPIKCYRNYKKLPPSYKESQITF